MIHYYYAKIAYSCCTSRTSKVEVAMLLESMLLVVQGRVKKATWWSAGKLCLRGSKRSLWLSADTFHTSEVAYWTAAPKLSLGGEGGVHLLAACSLCIVWAASHRPIRLQATAPTTGGRTTVHGEPLQSLQHQQSAAPAAVALPAPMPRIAVEDVRRRVRAGGGDVIGKMGKRDASSSHGG
ncbi:unnamed protein product [Phytophthora lilii]|uniref:Unnamed protein product n=1 Tax=Phytophthora lilii TaxID=2077276 RepID=A0A9W6TWC9_9STRA|nr:unnamed protein product [Phytophthora lilii]